MRNNEESLTNEFTIPILRKMFEVQILNLKLVVTNLYSSECKISRTLVLCKNLEKFTGKHMHVTESLF